MATWQVPEEEATAITMGVSKNPAIPDLGPNSGPSCEEMAGEGNRMYFISPEFRKHHRKEMP